MNSAASRLGCVPTQAACGRKPWPASRGRKPWPQAVAASRGRKPWPPPSIRLQPKHTYAVQAYVCNRSIPMQPKHTYANQAGVCNPSRLMQPKHACVTQAVCSCYLCNHAVCDARRRCNPNGRMRPFMRVPGRCVQHRFVQRGFAVCVQRDAVWARQGLPL